MSSRKISTLNLTVQDLECRICSKKIRNAIFKLQVREQIHTFNYEMEKNAVTISGPFDPQKLKKKLWRKAGKEVIKEIKIQEEEEEEEHIRNKPPPPPNPVQTDPPEEPEKEKPAEADKFKKPSRKGLQAPESTKTVVVTESQPFGRHYGSIVGPAAVPACCWRPCYVQCYDGCWCSSCGMYIERRMWPLPPLGGYRGESSWEEGDYPSCSVM
ncbi:hypothetical protein KSP40_PGU011665 [Platanthera guangdongensis]|uniref:HMA domain-containing protein n=1 Tax=Platanthera guangdongensis TaxID=2320717 RepID=A0ABR2LEI9_9ASPA